MTKKLYCYKGKHSAWLVFILLCYTVCSYGQQDTADDETLSIVWSKNKLKFSDFKAPLQAVNNGDIISRKQLDSFKFTIEHIDRNIYAVENRKYMHDSGSLIFLEYLKYYAHAYTSVYMLRFYSLANNRLSYSICSKFNKYSSYIAANDTNALEHEQLHFDICELYARKLKETLHDSLSIAITQEEVKIIGDRYLMMKRDMDIALDNDALKDIAGKVSRSNKIWRKKIDAELKRYDAFAETNGEVILK